MSWFLLIVIVFVYQVAIFVGLWRLHFHPTCVINHTEVR